MFGFKKFAYCTVVSINKVGNIQERAKMLADICRNLHEHNENKTLLKKYFKPKIVEDISEMITPTYESNLGDCIFTGCFIHDSSIGVNAPDPEAYTTMAPLFNAVIKDFHKLNPKQDIFHPASYFGSPNDLDSSDLDPEGQYIVGTRVQVNRNLTGYPFASKLTPELRMEVESKIKESLTSLSGEYEGSYYPVGSLGMELKEELAKEFLLFDENDKYLAANGSHKGWPEHRGMYVNDSNNFVAWVNGEDHLQLFSTQKGFDIAPAYRQMTNAVKALERKLSFVRDDGLGYLTFWLTTVGTGLHAVFHVKIPHLAARKNFETVCDKLGLTAESLQKVPMEGVDIVHAVANKQTIGISEADVMSQTIAGIRKLIQLEKDAAEGKDSSKCVLS